MGLKSAKTLFNKPSSQRWDTSENLLQINRLKAVYRGVEANVELQINAFNAFNG